MKEDFKIKVSSKAVFRKWDVIQVNSTGRKQIVIRCEVFQDGERLTIKDIPNFKWKLLFWAWFKILKIRVWLADKLRKTIKNPPTNQ